MYGYTDEYVKISTLLLEEILEDEIELWNLALDDEHEDLAAAHQHTVKQIIAILDGEDNEYETGI